MSYLLIFFVLRNQTYTAMCGFSSLCFYIFLILFCYALMEVQLVGSQTTVKIGFRLYYNLLARLAYHKIMKTSLPTRLFKNSPNTSKLVLLATVTVT